MGRLGRSASDLGSSTHSGAAAPKPFYRPYSQRAAPSSARTEVAHPAPSYRPGEVVHSLDGRHIAFESAAGTFLQRSWGYVASWHSMSESDPACSRLRGAAQPCTAPKAHPLAQGNLLGPSGAPQGGDCGGAPVPAQSRRFRRSDPHRWYLLGRDANASAVPPPAVWSMCNRVRPGVRCVGYRCGLEFKMPMRTAAVGWAVAVTSRKRGREVSN